MEIREGSYHHWHRPGWWPGDGSARDMFMVCSLQLNAAVLQCCSNELMDVPSLASLSPLSFSPYTDTGHVTWHTCPRPLLAASSEDFVIPIEHDHDLHSTAHACHRVCPSLDCWCWWTRKLPDDDGHDAHCLEPGRGDEARTVSLQTLYNWSRKPYRISLLAHVQCPH